MYLRNDLCHVFVSFKLLLFKFRQYRYKLVARIPDSRLLGELVMQEMVPLGVQLLKGSKSKGLSQIRANIASFNNI